MESSTARMSVRREPLTYERASPHSFYADSWRSKHEGDNAARQRLESHEREVRYELGARRAKATREAGATFERRVNPNNVFTGDGSSLTPPLWAVDEFVTAARPGRVIAAACPTFPLADGVASVNVPRIATGTSVTAAREVSAAPSQDFTDEKVSSNVVTCAGYADVSLQMLQQSGTGGAALDYAVTQDLLRAYDQNLELQVTFGRGSSYQELQGITETPSIGNVTFTAATPVATELFKPLGEAFATVGNTRKLPPEAVVTRTGRWAWIGAGEDEDKRPLNLNMEAQPPLPPADIYGNILGVAVRLSDVIPSTLTTGKLYPVGKEDVILVIRPSDFMLWEATPKVSTFEEVLSGSLSARVRLHNYAAFIVRYPSAVCTITGTGLIPPSGF